MYDTDADYTSQLNALERRHAHPGRGGRRVWLFGAVGLFVWALCVPLGQSVGLLFMALGLLLWGLVPHHWIAGPPLPPELVPTLDHDTARVQLASDVCWWAGLVGNAPALLAARIPLERELLRRHPEWPRPRYWLRFLVVLLVLIGVGIWGIAFLVFLAQSAS